MISPQLTVDLLISFQPEAVALLRAGAWDLDSLTIKNGALWARRSP